MSPSWCAPQQSVLDSSGSSVSSSTYNSAEEGDHSNGAYSAGTEDIPPSGVNPFVFDEHTLPSKLFRNGLTTTDEYLSSNSVSSPSTSPPIQLVNNNAKFKKGLIYIIVFCSTYSVYSNNNLMLYTHE